MKKNIALICIFIANTLIGQNSLDVSYLSSGGKLKPLQAIIDIRHYDINLDVNIAERTIQGNTIVSLNLSKQTDTILLDLVHLLKVSKVLVNKKAVRFEQMDDKKLHQLARVVEELTKDDEEASDLSLLDNPYKSTKNLQNLLAILKWVIL